MRAAYAHAAGPELDDQLGSWQVTDQVGLGLIAEHHVGAEQGDEVTEIRNTVFRDRRGR
jgi:hypothetical protein